MLVADATPADHGRDVAVKAREANRKMSTPGGKGVRYHEWDAAIQDYRTNWSRVFERDAVEGASEFVEETLAMPNGAGPAAEAVF